MMVSFGNASGPVDPFPPSILAQKGSLFLTRPTLYHYIATRAELEASGQRAVRRRRERQGQGRGQATLRPQGRGRGSSCARSAHDHGLDDPDDLGRRLRGFSFAAPALAFGRESQGGGVRKFMFLSGSRRSSSLPRRWRHKVPQRRLPKSRPADFAAMPEFTKPKLSPDGHRIAARSVTGGKYHH